MDAWKQGVIEPLKIKTQAISSASEVAVMILRIDDVIASGRSEPQMPQGMPPGMPQRLSAISFSEEEKHLIMRSASRGEDLL